MKDNIDILMISETKLINLFLKGSFNFVTSLNHIDLIEMEMLVEYFYLSVTVYPKDLKNLK